MATLHEVLDNIGGALRIAGTIITQPITRSYYRRWGATDDEVRRALPGDERVPRPISTTTLAITIQAPASEVWPWVAQLGQERGGMYSYELLENLARCRMRNSDRVVPEWEMKVGDQMRMGPPGYPVHQVVALERGHWLLMAGADFKTGIADPLPQPGQTTYTNYAWVLYLDEQPDGATRLVNLAVGHQLGQLATRTIPAAFGTFRSGEDAWMRRVQSGQAADLPKALPPHPRLLFSQQDLPAIKQRAAGQFKTYFASVKSQAGDWLEREVKLPDRGGQWYHWYSCPTHGARLRTEGPTRHVCPVDQQVFTGYPYDDVVISSEHNRLAGAIRTLGLAYQLTGDARYAARAKEILLAYAAKYESYPLHDIRGQPKVGGGKVGPQTLDESTWLITVVEGAETVVATVDIPEEGVVAGDLGTIIDIYLELSKAYGVEFLTASGSERALVTMAPSQFRRLTPADVLTARQIH